MNLLCLLFHDWEDIPDKFVTSGSLMDEAETIFKTNYRLLSEELQSYFDLENTINKIRYIKVGHKNCKLNDEEKLHERVCLRCFKINRRKIDMYLKTLMYYAGKQYRSDLKKAKRKLKAKNIDGLRKE